MRILVAVDDAEGARRAAERLIAQFKPKDVQIRIVHVVQPISVSTPPQMSPGFTPELEGQMNEARKLVQASAKQLSEAGFEVETSVATGDTREEVVDSAADWKADLIVVGARGTKGIRRLLLGSVADYVIRHAPCSVEIVRAPETSATKERSGPAGTSARPM